MKRILLASILLTSSSIAQLNVAAHVGLDAPSPSIVNSIQSPFLEDTWSNGIIASLGADYGLTNNIFLAPSFEYAYYPWHNYTGQGTRIPEDPPVLSSHGDGSKGYRIILEGRLLASRQFAGLDAEFYLTTGLGYTIEDFSTTHAVLGFGNGPTIERDLQYQNRNYWVHTLGIATRTSIVGPLSLDISAKYLTDYSKELSLAFNVGVAYSIIQVERFAVQPH